MTHHNEEEYFEGLIIAGSPHEISQAISKIIAQGFEFEFHYDPQYLGDSIIVLAKGRTESDVLEAPGLVDAPPVEEVIQDIVEAADEVNEVIPESATAPGVPAVEVTVAPELEEIVAPPVDASTPKPRGRKPKAVEAEAEAEVTE